MHQHASTLLLRPAHCAGRVRATAECREGSGLQLQTRYMCSRVVSVCALPTACTARCALCLAQGPRCQGRAASCRGREAQQTLRRRVQAFPQARSTPARAAPNTCSCGSIHAGLKVPGTPSSNRCQRRRSHVQIELRAHRCK
eukprot:6211065-Pleurochrysis_carterae.AAC.6